MKINLEILSATYLVADEEISDLRTKELVPKMVFRRRLTRAAKLVVEAVEKVGFENGRIVYGSAFGELKASANILSAILNDQMISPTDFQNSVYNTAVSYLSILKNNKNEILTISSGDKTAEKILKVGAIKALDGDEILLLASETMNIENIEQINKCINTLENVVALKVRVTEEKANINILNENNSKYPESISQMIEIAKNYDENKQNVIEIQI
ncbi:beta-ketoacyl synthase chain length factor [Poseidonibacter lekithochrous]|uniref:beta-ketoacyl synthase chain length factor n=1 Tax=Poseidonibacter lekithochrous TaxID=1904463 RepID=UPI0008FC3D7D|nr:beta-ketoacyl synthase chain length factor [Poseidonibacter lekithochrous]QKJ21593.1 beta-ketoacyl synthase domain-containing protein [Poseidonibacter lekithochrous]